MRPTIRSFLRAEVKCYLCGAYAGALERERNVSGAALAFQPVGTHATTLVRGHGGLRCPRCGGGVFLDEVEVVERRVEPVDWPDEGPRRGRPPKWLVDQRRRRSSNGSHAA